VEGANGIGRPLAQRLLAAGELVLDVPAKLAARARVFDTGQGRKTDATDAHAIVMIALRDKGLRQVSSNPELTVLRLLCDRRDELPEARAQALNRMHRLFPGLVPGGAPVKKSAAQYKKLLATVRPRDPAGQMRRRMAAEELADIDRLDDRLKAMKAELKAAVLATGLHLMGVHGIGPAGAARILADVGDISRFPSRGHFASWTGTAPIDASSGQHIRHRLCRAGNRRINHVLYMAGIVQLRHDTAGRRYYRRRLADGKTPMEAVRCLRRRCSARAGRPGRALGGVSVIQRGRPFPGHRLFGSATSRARPADATPGPRRREARRSGNRRHAAPACRRCQRAAPRRTKTLTPTSAGAHSNASRTPP
jgi:transposase